MRGRTKMNIEPKRRFGGIDGFEGYPPNTGSGNEKLIKCDPGDGGGGDDGGWL